MSTMPTTFMSWILVSLILFLAVGLFTGCAESDDRTEVTLWHQLNYAERVVLDEQVARFEEQNPDIKITALYRETEELRSGYQNSALAGRGPELIHGPSDQVGPFATMGIIRPLEDIFSEPELAELDSQALVWYDDYLYQVADRFGNHLTLVYNKEFVPEPPQTIAEMIEIGQANTLDLDVDSKTDRFGLVWNFTEPFFFIPFFTGFGGQLMDDQYRPTLDTEANVRALQFVQDLRDKYKITPQNADYEVAHTLFKEGQAAMIINGDWSWATYIEDGIDIGVARIPYIEETQRWPSPLVSPRGFSLNVNIAEEKLAATHRFLSFLMSTPEQRELAARTGIMPSRLSLRDDPVITDNPIMRGSLLQIEVGTPMPVVPELRAIWDAMRPSYQAVLGGAVTPEEAAATMQSEAERKIREMNEVIEPAGYVPVLQVIAMLGLLALFIVLVKPLIALVKDLRSRSFIYLMILPAFIVIFITVVYPFAYNVVLSLSNMGLRNFFSWDVIGFQNYVKVFSEPGFWSVFGKTIIWTVSNIVFHVTIGVFLALLLHRVLPGRGVIRTLLILPWAVPQYITALTWRGMFNQEYGAINLVITRFLHMDPVNWLGSPTEAFLAVILTNVWLGFPFMMVVALGGLQSIPTQLYEAAEIDGAGWWTKLRTITLPLLKPVMAPAIVLGTVWTFNNLNVIWLVSNAGEPSDNTHILVSFVYKSAFNLYRYGYAAAMSMVIFAILLAFGVYYLRTNKATETVY
ncbi:extracellular solute-binding protein [bacterium]|nr:extracellular solute-binding protein [bacterium]